MKDNKKSNTMEDNKTPRTLSEEELEKVSGGSDPDSAQECAIYCAFQQFPPKNFKFENGVCTCIDTNGTGGENASITTD